MTPAAPTATWRKVCEEYFSRLIEDLEQQVESEVESRVTAAIDAAVQGAVANATGESRRALAEELNQGVRRLRKAADADELYSTLLDVTVPFCEQAVVFSIQEKLVRAERMRRPAGLEGGESPEAPSLPPLEFKVSDAAAFATAIDTRDPVVAMTTAGEISNALLHLFGSPAEERVFLFPLVVNQAVTGVFYAVGSVQAPSIELLAEVAALRCQAFTVVSAAPAVELAAAAAATPAPAQLVSIAGAIMAEAETAVAGLPTAPGVKPDGAQPHKEWWDLSRREQQLHLAAQRFARVQVAEMRLAQRDAVRSGREARDIYGALKTPIDAAREAFREKHMTASPTMVDYLHLELVRSLANDDAILLGPNYPGPLV